MLTRQHEAEISSVHRVSPASTGKQLSFSRWQLPRFNFRRLFRANKHRQ